MTKVLAHRILKPDEHGRGWCRVIGNWRDGDATKKTLDYIRQYHGGNCIVQRAYSEPGDCISVHPTPITPFYPLPKEQPMEELRGSGNEFLRRVAREGDPGASVSMSVADLQHLFKRLDNVTGDYDRARERIRSLTQQAGNDSDLIEELEQKLSDARGHNTELHKRINELDEQIKKLSAAREAANARSHAWRSAYEHVLSYVKTLRGEVDNRVVQRLVTELLKYHESFTTGVSGAGEAPAPNAKEPTIDTLVKAAIAHADEIGTYTFEVEHGERQYALYNGQQRDVITMAAANLLGKWQRNGGGLANGPLEVQLARVWLTVFPLNPA